MRGPDQEEEARRKAAQEVEIDHLLSEEFTCNPDFARGFLELCGQHRSDFVVDRVIPEPSLGGSGFGDVLVEGRAGTERIVLLIEDKISAGPGVRQADRYRDYADRLYQEGWDRVWTILVAPSQYQGEAEKFDARVTLEDIHDILASPSPERLAYRRAILKRAIDKIATTGVRVPDPGVHAFKAAYLEFASDWCARQRVPMTFPPLRDAYYDGDSWIERIGHASLPQGVFLRHRCWTTLKNPRGQVDLIQRQADAAERDAFAAALPEGVEVTGYSSGRGVQASIPVAEMRATEGFDAAICADALAKAVVLVDWYVTTVKT